MRRKQTNIRKRFTRPFYIWMNFAEEINNILKLSVMGIHSLPGIYELQKSIIEYERRKGNLTKDSKRMTLKYARKIALLAKSEDKLGYPILYAHALISIWGALEALIDDIFFTWLRIKPETLNNESLAKVRIPLSRFESLNRVNRAHLLLEELKRDKGSAYKPGIAGFEHILECVGLSSSLEDDDKRILIEMKQIRNLLLHRRGIVDHRAMQACPWMKWRQGQKLRISREDYDRCFSSVCKYLTSIVNRLPK